MSHYGNTVQVMARNAQLPQYQEGRMPAHLSQMMGEPGMPPHAMAEMAEARAMAEAFEAGFDGGPPLHFMDVSSAPSSTTCSQLPTLERVQGS